MQILDLDIYFLLHDRMNPHQKSSEHKTWPATKYVHPNEYYCRFCSCKDAYPEHFKDVFLEWIW